MPVVVDCGVCSALHLRSIGAASARIGGSDAETLLGDYVTEKVHVVAVHSRVDRRDLNPLAGVVVSVELIQLHQRYGLG